MASAVRQGMRLISVVMGTDSDAARMRESQKLLSYGFRYYETQSLYEANVTLKEQALYYGEADTVSLGVANEVILTFPRGYYKDIEAELIVPKQLEAPIAKGQEVGELKLRLSDKVIFAAPLVALEEVPEAGMFARMVDFVSLFFAQLLSGD